MLIEPEYGYGWFLIGTTSEPLEIELPEEFQATISEVVFESGIAHAVLGRCNVCIRGYTFSWIGLIPRTDSEIDLDTSGVFCKVILSSTAPVLMKSNALPNGFYFQTDAKVFVRGSARVVLVS